MTTPGPSYLIGSRERDTVDVDAQPSPPHIDLTEQENSHDTFIDLTNISDSDSNSDDLEIIGCRFKTTGSNKQQKDLETERLRAEGEARRKDNWNNLKSGSSPSPTVPPSSSAGRESSIGSGSWQTGASRASSYGMSSSVRPKITNLGSRPRPVSPTRYSEPPRKKARIRLHEHQTPPSTNPESLPQLHIQQSLTPASRHAQRYSSAWKNYRNVDVKMDFIPQEFTGNWPLDIPTPQFTNTPEKVKLRSSMEISQDTIKVESGPFAFEYSDYDTKPVLNSDDDDSIKPDAEAYESSDSEEDYDRLHEGYCVNDESRWKIPICRREDDDISGAFINGCSLGEKKDGVLVKEIRSSKVDSKFVRPPEGNGYIWELFTKVKKPASATRHSKKPSKLCIDAGYGRIRYVSSAMQAHRLPQIPGGAINRMSQHNGWLAIGCARSGGQPDVPGERPEAYNCDGSLVAWNEEFYRLKGHSRIPKTDTGGMVGSRLDETSLFEKHYTINDVNFNNSGNSFVSTGMDKKAKVWKLGRSWKETKSIPQWTGYDLDYYVDSPPLAITFNPNEQDSDVVAISSKDIHVYPDITRHARESKVVLKLASDTYPNHNAGDTCWDPRRPHIIYASSEPQSDEFEGIHKAFDVNKGSQMMKFNLNEAGDAMAIGNLGTLALATRQEEGNFLRIFDINSLNRNHAQAISLEPFSPQANASEVNHMSFSPDGLYLAVARSDNAVHVYDSRMIDKGLLHHYPHEAPRYCYPDRADLYGVFNAKWVTTRSGQYILLSGGEDGCVRLWKPMWSRKEPSNGQAIAEVDSDIGVISVGDPSKNEHELVVGDSSGHVTIFTGLSNYL